MLPSLDCLSLRTGEFYPLSQPEVDQLRNNGVGDDPISFEPFQTEGNGWRTFRVRINEPPRADGEYRYYYYEANGLWRHYNSATPRTDPQSRQPIWYEDWMSLREAYAPTANVPFWVYGLPTLNSATVKEQPPTVGTLLSTRAAQATASAARQRAYANRLTFPPADLPEVTEAEVEDWFRELPEREDLDGWPNFATLAEQYYAWDQRFNAELQKFDTDPTNSNRFALLRAHNAAERTGLDAFGVLNGGDIYEPNTDAADWFYDAVVLGESIERQERVRVRDQELGWDHAYVSTDEAARLHGDDYDFLERAYRHAQQEWDNLINWQGTPQEHADRLREADATLRACEDDITEDMQRNTFTPNDDDYVQAEMRTIAQHQGLRTGLLAFTRLPYWMFDSEQVIRQSYLEMFESRPTVPQE